MANNCSFVFRDYLGEQRSVSCDHKTLNGLQVAFARKRTVEIALSNIAKTLEVVKPDVMVDPDRRNS